MVWVVEVVVMVVLQATLIQQRGACKPEDQRMDIDQVDEPVVNRARVRGRKRRRVHDGIVPNPPFVQTSLYPSERRVRTPLADVSAIVTANDQEEFMTGVVE